LFESDITKIVSFVVPLIHVFVLFLMIQGMYY